nr:hypothetical protein CFP56_20829 [Quercus suber]
MFIGINQTHVPPNGFVHVIKNEEANLPHTHAHVSPNGSVHVIKNEEVDLPHILVEGQISLLSGYYKAKELDVSFLGDTCGVNDGFHSRNDHNFYKKISSTSTYGVGSSSALLAKFYSQGKKYDVADLLKCARPFTIKVAVGRDVKRKLLVYPVYMESRLSTIGVDNLANGGLGDFLADGVSKDPSADGGLGDSPADSVLEDFPAKGGLGDSILCKIYFPTPAWLDDLEASNVHG